MISVTKLRQKPRHFHAFTGLTVAEFDQLLAALTPLYQASQEQRRNQPNRQRHPAPEGARLWRCPNAS